MLQKCLFSIASTTALFLACWNSVSLIFLRIQAFARDNKYNKQLLTMVIPSQISKPSKKFTKLNCYTVFTVHFCLCLMCAAGVPAFSGEASSEQSDQGSHGHPNNQQQHNHRTSQPETVSMEKTAAQCHGISGHSLLANAVGAQWLGLDQ